MREFLKTKGFKMTPQRELVFRAFFEMGEHVTVDELFNKVRSIDSTVGYSTVWRNLKLICQVGLAEEVNLGDGVTRYDRITQQPHGHFYCVECKSLTEFDMEKIVNMIPPIAEEVEFQVEGIKCELHGTCKNCTQIEKKKKEETAH